MFEGHLSIYISPLLTAKIMNLLLLVLCSNLPSLKTVINTDIINNIRYQQKHWFGNKFKYTIILKGKVQM